MPVGPNTPRAATPAKYRITVEGKLDRDWATWLDHNAVVSASSDPQTAYTVLEIDVLDQPGLRGMLGRIWDLNLVLVAVTRLTEHDGGTP